MVTMMFAWVSMTIFKLLRMFLNVSFDFFLERILAQYAIFYLVLLEHDTNYNSHVTQHQGFLYLHVDESH